MMSYIKVLLLLSVSWIILCPGTAAADSIDDLNDSWVGEAWSLQRKLDLYSPIADNNIIGTHNSFNSEVYRTATAYIDPQQVYSIYNQLRMGARFLELDTHWTFKTDGWPWEWGNALLLCHSSLDSHLGCSPMDRYLSQGLDEIVNWLNLSENSEEVIILYPEDHMDGHYGDALNLFISKFGDKIYRPQSGGCEAIPSDLTKADVLTAGKQVIIEGAGCTGHSNYNSYAFTGLGDIDRNWEDGTTASYLLDILQGDTPDMISADDVVDLFKNGANIVNFDDMVPSDSRIAAGVWSWDENEPNNSGGNQDCAVSWTNGRWDDQNCSTVHNFACHEPGTNNWIVSDIPSSWDQGVTACEILPGNYEFDVPTNSYQNEQLKIAKEDAGVNDVWLYLSDQATEGEWLVTNHSSLTKASVSVELALLSAHNTYFVAENNGGSTVNANRTAIGSWEKFTMAPMDSSEACIAQGTKVSIQTSSGYYWSAQSNGGLDADRNAIGSWETFELINHSDSSGCLEYGDTISLYNSSHKTYVCGESDGDAVADRTAIGSWEKLKVVKY